MASAPLLAVCCQGADALALFDLASGERLGTVPVGGHPVHATVVGEQVLVATMDERAITVIDRHGEVGEIPLGALGPSHFAIVDDDVYVACTASDVVGVVDPIERRLLQRIGVAAGPHELVAVDDLVFVGTREGGTIDVLDAGEQARVGQVQLGEASRIEGMAADPDGRRVYGVDAGREEVVAVEAGPEPNVIAAAPIGADPYELSVGERVFVPGRADGTVRVLEPDLTERECRTGYDRPVDVLAADGGHWVVERGRGRLSAFEGGEVSTPAGAIAGVVTDAGIVLSHYDDDKVSLVDPDDGVQWSAAAPANPFGAIVV